METDITQPFTSAQKTPKTKQPHHVRKATMYKIMSFAQPYTYTKQQQPAAYVMLDDAAGFKLPKILHGSL